MTALLRTYRLMASVLSVLLLLSATLPLVLAVCCEKPMHQPAEPPCHDMSTDTMHDRAVDAVPSPMHHGGMHDECCVIQSAQTPILPSLLLKEATPLPVLQPILLAFSTQDPPAMTAQPSLLFADAAPPAPPLSLHVLNGSFLN